MQYLLFLVTNCANTKKTSTVANIKKNSFAENLTSYTALKKSERKNFFKDSDPETRWVDSIYNKMTVQEKIGQLYMISAYSNKDSVHENKTKALIKEYNKGCVIFFQGLQRGLGFDKRDKKDGPTCGCVSESSFGHTGFTGDIAWVDPETEIVYIFLSNRTYPEETAEGNKLSKEKIREDIQQIIQDAIIK